MNEEILCFGEPTIMRGILTHPNPVTHAPGDKPVVLMTNAGLIHKVGPHRLWVDLARLLSEDGYAVFRFDITGLGDSDMRDDDVLDEKRPAFDMIEVMNHLTHHYGARRFVLMGLCSGADNGHHVAVQDSRVAGMVYIDGMGYRTTGWYFVHYFNNLIQIKKWPQFTRTLFQRLKNFIWPGVDAELQRISPKNVIQYLRDFPTQEQAEIDLRRLVARKADMLFIYTSGVAGYINHMQQFYEMFPQLKRSKEIQIEYHPQADHTFTLGVHRTWLQDTIRNWMRRF